MKIAVHKICLKYTSGFVQDLYEKLQKVKLQESEMQKRRCNLVFGAHEKLCIAEQQEFSQEYKISRDNLRIVSRKRSTVELQKI